MIARVARTVAMILAVAAVAPAAYGQNPPRRGVLLMLYIAPSTVEMSRAAKDYPTGTGPLTPDMSKPGRYSPSGVYGDATLASRAKGEKVVEAMLSAVLRGIETLRSAPLPGSR